MAIGDDILIERLANREAQLSQQSDTLDVKASILLVAIIFLASQSADLLTKHPRGWIHWEQVSSIVVQVVAAVLLALQLRVQTYKAEASEDYPKWRDELLAHHEGDAQKAENALKLGIIEGSVERVRKTNGFNSRKASWVDAIFWITVASLALNLIALAPLLIC